MNQRADLLSVDSLTLCDGFGPERWQIGSATIFRNLLRALPAGNRTTDRIEHQDPAQCELAHRRTRRQERTNLFHSLEAEIIVDPRKSLAYVNSISMTIEVTMIIGGERGV